MWNVGETTRSSREAFEESERPDGAGAAHAMARLLATSLRRADERLLTCLDNLLDCFAILSAVRDEDGRIVDFHFDYANGAACGSSGLGMEQQVGQRLLELMPDHRENGLFDRYRRVVETGESLRMTAVSWGERAFDIHAVKLDDGFAVSFRDVSARVATEQRLRHNEESFRLAAEAVGAIIYELDLKNQTIQRYCGIAQVLGYDPKLLPTESDWYDQLIHPDDRQRVFELLNAALDSNRILEMEYRLRHFSGNYIDVLDRALVLRDDEGLPCRVIGCVMDITQQKRLAESVRPQEVEEASRIRNDLIESEQRFRSTFEQAAVGMAHVTLDGRFIRVNDTLCRTLQYSRRELLSLTFMEITHPDDLPGDLAVKGDLISGALDKHAWDKRYVRRDGTPVWAHRTVSLARDAAGAADYFIIVVEDITERKRIEQELLHAKRAAEEAVRAKDKFFAILSHELRTPLTPVLGLAHLIAEDRSLPEETRHHAGVIRRNVEVEARLVDDLLDLNRVTAGKLRMESELVDVHAAIAQVVEMLRPDADRRGQTLEVALDAPRCVVRGDGARLQQVFWNLLRNAIKFTPDGGRLQVRSSGFEEAAPGDDAGLLVVEVEDSGIGMDIEQVERLFQPFEQGSKAITQSYGGLGLGLFIAHTIVQMHAGRLLASSGGPGAGSTFAVVLPLAKHATQPSVPDKPEPARAPVAARVLYVEDHADSAAVMSKLLGMDGHAVTIAPTVADALRLAAEQPFDVVVSDIGLPDGTGHDLMRALRQRHGLSGIALSGFGTPDDVRKSRDAGFAEHLTKPVNFAAVERAMQRVLAAARRPD
jgi:two-component system, chemotaxis family, CheB/CheR fusion protein